MDEIESMSDVDLLNGYGREVIEESRGYMYGEANISAMRDEILRRMGSRGQRDDIAVEPIEHRR